MAFSSRQVIATLIVVSLTFIATVTLAADEQESITGKLYCATLEGAELKLDPGTCPKDKKGFHVVRTKEGKIILLQDSPIMAAELEKLKIDRADDITITGKRTGPTIFTPESLRVR
jgi:hypothetical protein